MGRLAVALGIGAAVITGYGCGPAWADTPDGATGGSSTSDTSDTDTDASDTQPKTEPEPDEPEPDEPEDAEPEPEEEEEEPELEEEPEPEPADPVATGSEPDAPPADEPVDAPQTRIEATQLRVQADDDDPPPVDIPEADVPVAQELTMSTAQTVTTVIVPPTVPSLRPWPTAFDPATAVNYVVDLVTSVVNAVLSPFAAGLPAPPSGPPTLWTLLAWVRREFFNSSPTIAYNPVLNSQGVDENGDVVITGSIGADDVDGDPLTYTVIGRPLYGGVVEVADDGTFTYRPMNAMAAVGGYDEFVVVVDDEAAGFHLNGPLGLLQFVPIIGNLINPGGGHRVARTIRVDVTAVDGVDLSFPDDFHWGVAHSGFQAEGGPGSPVDPNSDWYKWVHDPLNQLLGLTKGVPENGPGAYVRYAEDAALARDELKMNTFRIGIEWSRIFSESTAGVDISDEGGTISLADLQALDALANQDEVQHYRDVLTALRAHGLEPMVTVTHFTLPAWIHDPGSTRLLAQFGLPAPAAGWLSPTTATEFEKYAAYLAWKYGDEVDNWATLNEPVPPVLTQFFALPGLVPAWPPGLIRPDLASTFLVNQAKAHVAAYDAIHAWDSTAFVGFTNNMVPARPANPVNPLDAQAADAWNQMFNRWFPNAVIDGWVDANLDGVKTADEIHPEFVDKVDFMGVQYYGSQPMQGFGVAPIPGLPFLRGLPVRCQASSPTCSDFNQPIDPGGFREVLEVAGSYGKPLWVTENGIADDEDTKRPSYIANHIAVVQDLVAHGADIRGYTYWSFVDNLEWSEGYHLQFGLYGSDPATPELERTPKPASIDTLSAIAGSNSLPLWVLAQYVAASST
ncbi:Beta-glucosidase/6-phospho-beta-glucosidase/beta-galactosidase [Mycolicibacterium rutilum]|uniref:Beta-glucosidase/6-phospho-beta-glucosidase/beta-galactosidase n=1 Tax=Mycolicibacterium rutilum TaxID=370526 RepID=A0A1H6JP15_MYCRU|nr:Beta-glucosidase/6-phospho-beta-glucosidase/beta-galactosidase [Mycolicibacterium rutilum]